MSARIYPVTFVWKQIDVMIEGGEIRETLAMIPLNAANASQARRQFHLDEEYPLAPLEARSRASHNAYFAEIHSYWLNLPEAVQARWLDEDHFRKWCLIETGWYHEREVDTASPQHAENLVALVKSYDTYARIHVRGNKVIIREAKSQSAKAMSKDPFERSKREVLDLMSSFVGVKPSQMKREVRRNG